MSQKVARRGECFESRRRRLGSSGLKERLLSCHVRLEGCMQLHLDKKVSLG